MYKGVMKLYFLEYMLYIKGIPARCIKKLD